MYIGCQIFCVHNNNNLLLKKKVRKSVRYNTCPALCSLVSVMFHLLAAPLLYSTYLHIYIIACHDYNISCSVLNISLVNPRITTLSVSVIAQKH